MANRWIESVLFGIRKVRNGFGGPDMVQRGTIEFRGATVSDNPVDGTTVVEINADLGSATPNATPNTIAKRNAVGNCAFAGLQCSSLTDTGNASIGGNASVTGTISAGGTIISSTNVQAQQFITTAGTLRTPGSVLALATNGLTPMLLMDSGSGGLASLAASLTAFEYRTSQPFTTSIYIDMTALADPTYWNFQSGFWTGKNLAGNVIQFPISYLLPQASQLEGAVITILPATHTNLPAVKPSFRIVRFVPSTGATQVIGPNPATDTSADFTAYNQQHIIGISGQTHLVDKTGGQYFLEFTGESGANSVDGLKIRYIQLTVQVGAGALVRPF